jgi:hypothetical protein
MELTLIMDVLIRAAQRVLAVVNALRHKRISHRRVRVPVSRRLQAGSSSASAWDRHRPGNFVSAKDKA